MNWSYWDEIYHIKMIRVLTLVCFLSVFFSHFTEGEESRVFLRLKNQGEEVVIFLQVTKILFSPWNLEKKNCHIYIEFLILTLGLPIVEILTLVPILTTRVAGGTALIISSEAVDWDNHFDTLILTPGLPVVEILTLVPILTTRVAV